MVEYFKHKSSGFKPRPAIDPGRPVDLHRSADGTYRPALPARSKIPPTGFKDGYSGRYFAPTPDRNFKPLAPNPQPDRSGHQHGRRYDGYGGAKDSIFGKLPSYRKFAGGAFGFLLDNADELQNWDWSRFWEKGDLPWGLSGDEVIRRLNEQNGILPGQNEPVPNRTVEKTPNGMFDDYLAFPTGGFVCTYQPAWLPGNDTGVPGDPYRYAGTGYDLRVGAGCSGWTSEAFVENGWKNSTIPAEWKWQALYSTYDALAGSWLPFYSRYWTSHPAPDQDLAFARVPAGSPVPEAALKLSVQTPATYLPGETTFGWPENPNSHAPKDWRGAMKAARLLTGTRYDSGYNPDVDYPVTPGTSVTIQLPTDPNTGGSGHIPPPTTGTTSPEPWHQGKKQEKYRIRGMGAFRLVQSVFHGLSEADDFIEAFYDALPKKRQTCKGQTVGGPTCKAAAVGKYWGEVDKVEAIVNLIVNHFEDKYIGKAMAAREKAAGRLGTKDWKIFNEVPGHVDDPMFEAYGEIAKNIVSPTKEGITSAVKHFLGVP